MTNSSLTSLRCLRILKFSMLWIELFSDIVIILSNTPHLKQSQLLQEKYVQPNSHLMFYYSILSNSTCRRLKPRVSGENTMLLRSAALSIQKCFEDENWFWNVTRFWQPTWQVVEGPILGAIRKVEIQGLQLLASYLGLFKMYMFSSWGRVFPEFRSTG